MGAKAEATKPDFDLATVRETCARRIAPWGENAATSRGRALGEEHSPTRTPFQRDRDRILHCDAFRRLMHKTQVFVRHEDDHFRTRLTHTMEVGQIARALARALRVDEDLAEALALVHDFGHTPFGHAGERVLNEKLKPFGGFDHNAQALRVVTRLERRYATFDGLNLTWETLEGLVKHNGPLTDRDGDALDHAVPKAIGDYNAGHDLKLWSWPSVEAQCAAIADDIAYDNHDLDDGLRAGLFDLADLTDVPLSGLLLEDVRAEHPDLSRSRTQHELVRRQITRMVEDVITEASGRLAEATPQHADDVRGLDYAVVSFSRAMEEQEKELKAFLFANMYRHERVMAPVRAGETIVSELYDAFFSGAAAMPDDDEWQLAGLAEDERAQRVTDYISGMTDRFAVAVHGRLFDRTPQLR
ncbi:MAG: deoxyguanosinetriphosphate triphosphohydrolase [Pseudomonadota bacterium]